jgi:YD repeat-containing protein
MLDVNVVALVKGSERFVFVYDDANRDAIISSIRDCAANADLSLNWFDAAVLVERTRQQGQRTQAEAAPTRTEL